MNTNFWNYWKLTSSRGRQIWNFVPPKENEFSIDAGVDGHNAGSAWDTEQGREFLERMSNAFLFDKTTNRNASDQVYRQQALAASVDKNIAAVMPSPPIELDDPVAQQAFRSVSKGIDFFRSLQMADGHWPGDYGGPMFLLPGLVIASYVTETPFPPPHQALMKRYFYNHQNDDGGWGLHVEGNSTLFGTVLQYVALRLLGETPDRTDLTKAREWIERQGGAVGIPAWGKFYLSVLGVYEWEGNNTLMPEMWLLPRFLPMHPWRYWCHCRMVYLPMAYCYGKKVTGPMTALVKALREELYVQDYASIDWKKARSTIATPDSYYPQSTLLKFVNVLLDGCERLHLRSLREKALAFIQEYIDAEDAQTDYVDIGPVNQVINSLCVWHAYGQNSPQFKKHVERWSDYLWVAEDGMKMSGYNGSQLWDTGFAAQAIVENGMEQYFPEVIRKAYCFIDQSQVRENVADRERFFRHISKGGWPFSTRDHGWPISDCTALGLHASLLVHRSGVLDRGNRIASIAPERLQAAVDVILSLQNADDGWATYENTRGPAWLERLNPSEIFGGIMIDYSYPECTSSCIQALLLFEEEEPEYRRQEIDQAIRRGTRFLRSRQRADGSWFGSWGVCFTYGTWFGVEALAAVRETTDAAGTDQDPHIKKACQFLLSKQNEDGGWGESFESCVQKRYIPHARSQIVNTCWALLSLMAADHPDAAPIENGIRFLLGRQEDNGGWPQESIAGVFNHNCMINYAAYRNIFPIWTLGRYFSRYKRRVGA
jgi:lanosterol synthase